MGMKKCCICGGPIHDGRCRDCGMPYRDESKMYRLNESRPREQKSDAAVREERVRTEQKQERPAAGKKQSQQYQRGSAARSAAKSRTYVSSSHKNKKEKNHTGKGTAVVIIIALLCVLGAAAVGFFEESQESFSEDFGYEEEYVVENEGDISVDEEMYAEGLPDLTQKGEEYMVQLAAGTYRVGWQIPEGLYTVLAMEDVSSSFSVTDEANGIWIYQSLTQDEERYGATSLANVRLYTGAEITLEGGGSVELQSSCADTAGRQQEAENPLTESFVLEMGAESSVTDIPEGYYNFYASQGWGPVQIREGEEDVFSVFMGSSAYEDMEMYRNVFVPAGSTVYLDEEYSSEDFRLELTPSEFVYGV